MNGRSLNKLLGLKAKHALFREDGKWYHNLDHFPGVLFDRNGYITFETEASYRQHPDLQIKRDLNVMDGISSIKGYKKFTEAQREFIGLKRDNSLLNDRSIPRLINNIEELLVNVESLEYYLTEGSHQEQREASKLIKRGTCFIAYKVNGELRFAPSRFLGYEKNKPFKFTGRGVDGRETNKVITKIVGSKPILNPHLEDKYLTYCLSLGIKPQPKGGAYGVKRKFWSLNLDRDEHLKTESIREFAEGEILERMHKSRERNIQVVQIAKDNFRKYHGKLFCEVCGFDFEAIYGEIGKDFIEGHHIKAISDMQPGDTTKAEDIAILCANCHRMIHKKRPWLSLEKLRVLLKPVVSRNRY
jgi:5-methylcytosine-specific restriction protein A